MNQFEVFSPEHASLCTCVKYFSSQTISYFLFFFLEILASWVHYLFQECPQIYTANGRWDMQRGIRILPEFGSSPAVTEMNLRIENKDFDLDEDGALTAINRFYDNIAESLKISNMPEMIPHQHIVKQDSRIVATDQSIARIPIFSKEVSQPGLGIAELEFESFWAFVSFSLSFFIYFFFSIFLGHIFRALISASL